MEPMVLVIGIILIAFTNFYRGVPAQCCRLVPRMAWDDSRQAAIQTSEEAEVNSKHNPA